MRQFKHRRNVDGLCRRGLFQWQSGYHTGVSGCTVTYLYVIARRRHAVLGEYGRNVAADRIRHVVLIQHVPTIVRFCIQIPVVGFQFGNFLGEVSLGEVGYAFESDHAAGRTRLQFRISAMLCQLPHKVIGRVVRYMLGIVISAGTIRF